MIALISTCNEGYKLFDCLSKLKKLNIRMVALNDGLLDIPTNEVLESFSVKSYEFNKIGCKEPHLVEFFSNQTITENILHLDYDEILSDDLLKEICQIKIRNLPVLYAVNMEHQLINDNGLALRYKKNSTRSSKVILFHPSFIASIVGLPHKGFTFSHKPLFLEGILFHTGNHLAFNLKNLIQRDKIFAQLDAALRCRRIYYFDQDSRGDFLLPYDSRLKKIDSYRFKYPIFLYIFCLLYRGFQSIPWLCESRNWITFKYELKVFISRMAYQYYLMNKIISIKYFRKN
jgi:hypothetical protein